MQMNCERVAIERLVCKIASSKNSQLINRNLIAFKFIRDNMLNMERCIGCTLLY